LRIARAAFTALHRFNTRETVGKFAFDTVTLMFQFACRYTAAIALMLTAAACGGGAHREAPGGERQHSAMIRVDGSSTVYPITEAVAEEFHKANREVNVTVGVSGTGGGFQKFCRGETDISDASRPIKPSEIEACRTAAIDYIELPIAYDGLAVVVHPKNTWARSMTVEELKKLWAPEAQGKITRWSQVRASWPDRDIHLFGAGVDSGTYDYFTDAIVGTEGASRGDFTSSEDDNVLVQGIAGDELALGFMGLAYVEQNAGKLALVAVDDRNPQNGDGPVAASVETVRNGTYQPLSRPLFIYVARTAMDRREVQAFVDSYFTTGKALVSEVGYVPLTDDIYELAQKHLADRKVGTAFGAGGSQVGLTLEALLARER
jgi:phosphate transport system substrate-binding protein